VIFQRPDFPPRTTFMSYLFSCVREGKLKRVQLRAKWAKISLNSSTPSLVEGLVVVLQWIRQEAEAEKIPPQEEPL